MILVIQHFLGSICHIVEVIDVDQWWDPLVFQGLYVISTLKICMGTFKNMITNIGDY